MQWQGLTRDELRALLSADELLDAMEEVLWEGVTRLGKQTASSGLELSAKFASDADYALQVIIPPPSVPPSQLTSALSSLLPISPSTPPPPPHTHPHTHTHLSPRRSSPLAHALQYGRLEVFFSGLEGLLGPPSMRVLEGIEREFCAAADAAEVFTTSNGMTTTSETEFEFVVAPQPGKAYPERADVAHKPQHRRKPLPPSEFAEALALRNRALAAEGHPELMVEEQIAGRLYTGPVYEKLNAVLRAQSGDPFLVGRFERLCLGNYSMVKVASW